MKKIIALLFAVALIATCAFSVSAADGISAEEQKIIDALSQKITMASGSIAQLDAKYINQAKDYLTKADLATNDINDILNSIDAAAEVIEKSEAENFSNLGDAETAAIVEKAQEAAEVIDAELHVTPGAEADSYNAKLVFNENSTVPGYTPADGAIEIPVTGNSVIKQTGAEGNMTAVIIGASVVMMGLAFVVVTARKKSADR